MRRISKTDLEHRVRVLNDLFGVPHEVYYRDDSGNYHRNKGTYSLDWCYGGVRLEREGGSICISPRGTKREVYEWIGAYIAGIWAARDAAND